MVTTLWLSDEGHAVGWLFHNKETSISWSFVEEVRLGAIELLFAGVSGNTLE
jgi:hypothetical protein